MRIVAETKLEDFGEREKLAFRVRSGKEDKG